LKQILLLDDDKDIVFMFNYFTFKKIKVHPVQNIIEFEKRLREEKFDAVVSDYFVDTKRLPYIMELVSIINPMMPVICMTGDSFQVEEICEVINKPFTLADFEKSVISAIEKIKVH
jgi:DNA-binding NtrC family response regulator